MPEGDTIHRSAGRLRPALAGMVMESFWAKRLAGSPPKAGQTITSVEAVGKHLLIAFDDGLTLQTHMKMTGSWHLYRRHERWRKPKHYASVIITVADWVAVCFTAPVVRTYRSEAESPVAHLGPDLTSESPDLDECVNRMAQLDPDTPMTDVLLDQRVCCGVGNVYKSEGLWACRVHPLTPVSEVDAATRDALVATAHRQLRANLGFGSRQTVPGGLAAYGRARKPCLRCETPLQLAKLGSPPRLTYWCARCQQR